MPRNEQIITLINAIDNANDNDSFGDRIGLPEFQREFVWKRPQVRELFRSLYCDYPIGGIMLWKTNQVRIVRQEGLEAPENSINFIVDGQQRITTLYSIIKGKRPPFLLDKQSYQRVLRGLHFDLRNQVFQYYQSWMRDDPRWIDLSKLYQANNPGLFVHNIQDDNNEFYGRLSKLLLIQNKLVNVEQIPKNFELKTVVEIFEKVNGQGTPINRADLALAFISTDRPKARGEIQDALHSVKANRYYFDESWLLRCLNAVVYSKSDFEALYEIPSEKFQNGLKRIKKHIRAIIEQIQAHLGLDHNHVLFGKPTLVTLAKYLDKQGGLRHRKGEVARMLYWYVSAAFWGRYSGANIGTIQQDLNAIDKTDGHWKSQLEALNNNLHHQFGEMKLWKEQFLASTRRPRAFPLLYLLTRSTNARDLCSGVPVGVDIHQHVNVHHIFPQAQLRKYEEFNSIRDVHNISNFTILSQPCNLEIRDKLPEDYLPKYQARHPGILQEHWIPEDPELWKIQNYRKFLTARSQLICDAANEFLAKLASGKLPSEA